MSKLIDLSGKRFGKLVVIERAENVGKGIAVWKCLCDCGNVTYVRGSNLKGGAVKSCGCLLHVSRNYTHRMSKTRIYREWSSIKTRCCYKTSERYKDYAPRGIQMCKEWEQSFEAFRDWAYANGYADNLSIERINNDKGYQPDNCKWIPLNEQANNRRTSYAFTKDGVTKNLAEWCKDYGVNYQLAHNRIHKLGWDFERAMTTPCDVNKRNKKYRGTL